MLLQLRIVNFAIIEEVEMNLAPGFNIITGETGAGKSIIIGAANLLRGGRMQVDMIRNGADEAVVEALFDISANHRAQKILDKAGISPDGSHLLVRRVIPRTGRSRIYINGALSTVGILTSITAHLLDICGQHEHQLLSDTSTHRRILDSMGVSSDILHRMEHAYAQLREIAQTLQASRMGDQERLTRLDYIKYQLEELGNAHLIPNEDVEIEAECIKLQRATELIDVSRNTEEVLYSGDQSVRDVIARHEKLLESLSSVDSQLEPMIKQLEEARLLIEDASHALRGYADGIDVDVARLNQLEERLDFLHRLKRKYGASVDEMLSKMNALQDEYDQLNSFEQRLEGLESEYTNCRQEAEAIAQELSSARLKAAKNLSQEVTKQLALLRMQGAYLEVEVAPKPKREGDEPAMMFGERKLSATGWDRVEFMISTNTGEAPRQLIKIASGGELARVMLAIRQVLGTHDPVSTSIYDEVDAGISGAVADCVGRALAQVARHRQVLCVTHLPQVAAYANAHFQVGKKTSRQKTHTFVQSLSVEEQVEELARMLGTDKVTSASRANAQQLIEAARSFHSN